MSNNPDPSWPFGLYLSLIVVLLLINGYFAAVEGSLSAVSKSRIRQLAGEGNKKATHLLKLLEHPEISLPTIQTLITTAGLMAGALTAYGLAGPLVAAAGLEEEAYSMPLAVVVLTLALTYVNLVISELYPKRIALCHGEKIALSSAGLILGLGKIVAPFNWILSASVHLLLILTRQKRETTEESFSEDDVKSMLEVGQETGVLNEQGKRMINSIFAFDDKKALEVMTPRTDVFYIDINDPPEEYLEELMELRYSRIPVYDDDNDNIIGILNIKDYLIKAREVGFENVDIRAILRKPFFVPATKNLETLFFDLQSARQQIAILIDEYGGFSGIVTMEDLIEEIVGDIDDEYDDEEPDIEQIDENTYRLDGYVSLKELNEELKLNLTSEYSETIGGFIMDILGEVPDDDDEGHRIIEMENCQFIIESVKDRRIEKIRLKIKNDLETEGSSENTENGKKE